MLPELLFFDGSAVESQIAFLDAVGTIPWTKSIRESKENCFPDIKIPRILLLIAKHFLFNSYFGTKTTI